MHVWCKAGGRQLRGIPPVRCRRLPRAPHPPRCTTTLRSEGIWETGGGCPFRISPHAGAAVTHAPPHASSKHPPPRTSATEGGVPTQPTLPAHALALSGGPRVERKKGTYLLFARGGFCLPAERA